MTRIADTVEGGINRRWSPGDSEADLAAGEVAIGDWLVAKRVRHTFNGKRNQPNVTLDIEVDDATSWRVVRLVVEGSSINGSTISGVPLADLATAALARAALHRREGGSYGHSPDSLTPFHTMRNRRRLRRGGPDLARVAEVYRKAFAEGSAPSKAVAEALGIAESTARKYVHMCRNPEVGLLPPTTRGQAQA